MNTTEKYYKGLSWTTENLSLFANSVLTPITYYISAPGETFDAYSCFPQKENPSYEHCPRIKLGSYKDLEIALLACEWNDYQYSKPIADEHQIDLLFIGSDKVSDFAKSLQMEVFSDHGDTCLIDSLIEDKSLPNGKPFRKMASYFEAKKTANKQNSDGSWTISFSVKPKEIPLWLNESALNSYVILGAVPLHDPEDEDTTKKESQDAFKRAHMLPMDISFQEWMLTHYDPWGLISKAKEETSEDVQKATLETLKRLIGISKRRDLYKDKDAVKKLEKLDREFYKDMAREHGIY